MQPKDTIILFSLAVFRCANSFIHATSCFDRPLRMVLFALADFTNLAMENLFQLIYIISSGSKNIGIIVLSAITEAICGITEHTNKIL